MEGKLQVSLKEGKGYKLNEPSPKVTLNKDICCFIELPHQSRYGSPKRQNWMMRKVSQVSPPACSLWSHTSDIPDHDISVTLMSLQTKSILHKWHRTF
jgi:hypothetical protein